MQVSINFEVVDADAINNLLSIIGGKQNKSIQPVPEAPKPTPAPTTPKPIQMPIPTKEETYTQDQLALAAMPILDAGRGAELVALLGQFGAQALTHLTEDQYGAFATALRGLGAKI